MLPSVECPAPKGGEKAVEIYWRKLTLLGLKMRIIISLNGRESELGFAVGKKIYVQPRQAAEGPPPPPTRRLCKGLLLLFPNQ